MWGRHEGRAVVAYGRNGHWRDGRYQFAKGEFVHVPYVWPGERDLLLDGIAQEMATGRVDVYGCPLLRTEPKRAKGNAAHRDLLWADADGQVADELLAELADLGAYAVDSGSKGHAHVYVPLTTSVDSAQREALCRALAARIGDCDAKFADNDVLRIPGTSNGKTDPPAPVTWRRAPTGRRADPVKVAGLLGVDLDAHQPDAVGDHRERHQVDVSAPVDLDRLPAWLRARLDQDTTEDRSAAFHGLVGACRDAGLTQAQAVSVMASWAPGRAKYGHRLAGEVLRCWSKVEQRPPLGAADPLPDEPWSELGYARRLVRVYGDRLRYVPAWRRWLVWDGTRWAPDTTGQPARWMKSIARLLMADATAVTDKDTRRSLTTLARRGESSAGVAGALTLASTEEGIAVTPDDLDADPFLLNCVNGTLDLRTLELRPHDPADLLTKVTGAAYDPDAHGAEFTTFLERVQPKEEMRAYLARLFGHALEGRVVEHILPICWGDGANGKGTFLTLLLAALGDYGDAADPELLTARTFDAHPTGVADLFGLRLAVLHEGDAGRRLAEGTVKRLTGGDRVKARRMREDFWHFDPSHTFVMLTNHKPLVQGTDEGIWRRIRLVPWDVVVPEDERDEHLGDRLALEADAMLAWLVAGYRDWHARGLAEPERVTYATAEFRAESDALARFLDNRCLLGPHFTARSSELYAAWCKWCTGEGEDAGTQKAFTTALQGKGYDTKKDGTGRMRWHGIGLAADDEEAGE